MTRLLVPFLTVCLCDRNETVVQWKQILRITDNGASFKLNQMCLCQLKARFANVKASAIGCNEERVLLLTEE